MRKSRKVILPSAHRQKAGLIRTVIRVHLQNALKQANRDRPAFILCVKAKLIPCRQLSRSGGNGVSIQANPCLPQSLRCFQDISV